MRKPFKMKAGKEGPMQKNFPSAFKQDRESVQDNTRTSNVREITIPKFNAENAWKSGDKDKYNLMTQLQHAHKYNETATRIDEANKQLTTKFTDKEKQKIIDDDLTRYMDSSEFHNY